MPEEDLTPTVEPVTPTPEGQDSLLPATDGQDTPSGDPSDYLGDEDNSQEPTIERYKQQIEGSKQEALKFKKDLDDLVGFINADPELKELVEKKARGEATPTTSSTGVDVQQLVEEVRELKSLVVPDVKAKRQATVEAFEKGKNITPDLRAKMKPYTEALVKGGIPLEDALETAWVRMGGTKAPNSAQAKVNADGTSTSVGNVPVTPDTTVELSAQDMKLLEKMRFDSPEQKKRFLAQLKEKRNNK